jgi:thiamine transporter
MSPLAYSAAYNGSIIYGEGILTIIILMIPAVKSALATVKDQAKS